MWLASLQIWICNFCYRMAAAMGNGPEMEAMMMALLLKFPSAMKWDAENKKFYDERLQPPRKP